jgi:glutathione-independent formaldehyde dehydrogenase
LCIPQVFCQDASAGISSRGNGEHAKKGIFPFSIAEFFDKGITMGSGQAPVKKCNEYLRDLIVNGRAKPSKMISHRIQIEQAPDAYEKFDRRIDGYTKVVIRFGKQKAA